MGKVICTIIVENLAVVLEYILVALYNIIEYIEYDFFAVFNYECKGNIKIYGITRQQCV